MEIVVQKWGNSLGIRNRSYDNCDEVSGILQQYPSMKDVVGW